MNNFSETQMEEITNKLREFGLVLDEHLGRGFAGRVFSVYSVESKRHNALKIIDKSKILQEHVDRELRIALLFKHEHIVQTLHVCQTPNFAFIEMEKIRSTLLKYVSDKGPLSEKRSRTLFTQLILAVDYMHNWFKVAHGNITYGNILVDDNSNLKLADFCQSVQLTLAYPARSILMPRRSLHFYGPEFTLGDFHEPKRADVFSLGIILYFMLKKRGPLRNFSHEVDPNEIFKLPVSLHCRHMLGNMLHSNPEERFSTEEILKHDWLKR